MADKDLEEDYTESDVTLGDSKYPKFRFCGAANDDGDDLEFSFGPVGEDAITFSVTDDDAGELIFCTTKDKTKLYNVRFVDGRKRAKVDRVSVRYEQSRDLLYFRLRKFLRQEFSMEIDVFDEDEFIVDFDKKNRIIGWALLNASTHVPREMLSNLLPVWINIVIFNDGLEDSDEKPKSKKKQEKSQNKPVESNGTQQNKKSSKPNLLPGNEEYSSEVVNIKTPYYKHKFVRDLEWVLKSPFILANHESSATQLPLVKENWFDHLEKSPEEILQYYDSHPNELYEWALGRKFRGNNLGGYFVVLVNRWLLHCTNAQNLHVKYQLFSKNTKKTLGDFDFLFLDTVTGEWTQYECGIKFYLLLPDSDPNRNSFQGPHCTGDSLQKYLNKCLRQLSTKDDVNIQSQLQEEGVYPTRSSIFLKGWLFFPLNEQYYQRLFNHEYQSTSIARRHLIDFADDIFPELKNKDAFHYNNINPSHLVGWWARYPHEYSYTEEDSSQRDDQAALDAIAELESGTADESLTFDVLLLESDENLPVKQDMLTYSRWAIIGKQDYLSPVFVTPSRLSPPEERKHEKLHLLTYRQLKLAIQKHFSRNFRSIFIVELVPYERSKYKDIPNPINATYVEVSRGVVCGAHWPRAPQFANYRWG